MPRTRTTAEELQALAIEDLTAAVDAAGLSVEQAGTDSMRIRLDDSHFDVDVAATAYATGARASSVIDAAPETDRTHVLVADRITADARHLLADAGWGWFDRRGHLRLRAHGLLVDTTVLATTRSNAVPHDPIRGRAGVAIAYRLLTHPNEPLSVTRSGLGFAASTISEALARLRLAGIVDDTGSAMTPELFWALAERWAPQRTWLAEPPDQSGDDTARWCLTGTIAAAEHGAPVVSTGTPPDLYVPSPVVVTIAARRYGVARDATIAAASIAVAPTPDVTNETRPPKHELWPLAHPVAVALDLAQDRSRGREILEDWSPPERVW